MCRYAFHLYKLPYACFNCRKVFKQSLLGDIPPKQRPASGEKIIIKCPQCGKIMHSMGRDFKAPKQNDLKQWKKVEILFEHGFADHSCGCDGPGYRPATLLEVDSFLAENLPKSAGQKLLEKITQNQVCPSKKGKY